MQNPVYTNPRRIIISVFESNRSWDYDLFDLLFLVKQLESFITWADNGSLVFYMTWRKLGVQWMMKMKELRVDLQPSGEEQRRPSGGERQQE